MTTFIDLTGKRFGRWVVLEKAESDKNNAMWLCKCDCGNIKIVYGGNIKNGKSSSCGCFHKEELSRKSKTHGSSSNPIFSVWEGMKRRCYNKKYKQYKDWGGRGIKICEEWKNDPNKFIEWAINNGYNDKLCIDRINNDGDYEPSNCRWIIHRENSLNSRLLRSNNSSGYRGVSLCKRDNNFVATVKYHYKSYRVGSFNTAIEAAKARDKYIIDNGMDIPLNFEVDKI